jgi:hypothetical protein
MIKIILGFPVQVFQSISKNISRVLKLSQNPVQSSVLTNKGLIKAFIVALGISALYFYAEPYGIKEYSSANKNLLILLSSVAGFLGLLISDYSLPAIFKTYFKKTSWTLKKEISLYVLRFFFVGLMVMVFGNQTGLTNFNLPMFLLKFTAVGTLFGVIASFIKENRLRVYYQNRALEINEKIKSINLESTGSHPFPVIKFSGSNDKISLVPNQLVSAKISKYKTDFVYQNFFGTVNKTLDISAKEVIKELGEYSQFKRLNSKQFVNFLAVYKVIGNGAGYKVNVSKLNNTVQVSRKFKANLESI